YSISVEQEGDLKYTLYGVIVHEGELISSGHYYRNVRTSSAWQGNTNWSAKLKQSKLGLRREQWLSQRSSYGELEIGDTYNEMEKKN
ncbi:predicted protein, partial [Arabidopsis lyrata subsp. lyrata]